MQRLEVHRARDLAGSRVGLTVDTAVRTRDLFDLDAGVPKVSAPRLEQYLNPGNPIRSG